jgi:hypothetical protein
MFCSCGANPKGQKFPAEDCGIYTHIACTGTLTKTHRVFNASCCGFIFLFHTPKRRVVCESIKVRPFADYREKSKM